MHLILIITHYSIAVYENVFDDTWWFYKKDQEIGATALATEMSSWQYLLYNALISKWLSRVSSGLKSTAVPKKSFVVSDFLNCLIGRSALTELQRILLFCHRLLTAKFLNCFLLEWTLSLYGKHFWYAWLTVNRWAWPKLKRLSGNKVIFLSLMKFSTLVQQALQRRSEC